MAVIIWNGLLQPNKKNLKKCKKTLAFYKILVYNMYCVRGNTKKCATSSAGRAPDS